MHTTEVLIAMHPCSNKRKHCVDSLVGVGPRHQVGSTGSTNGNIGSGGGWPKCLTWIRPPFWHPAILK